MHAGIDAARVLRRLAAVTTLLAASVLLAGPAAAQARAGGHVLYQTDLFGGSVGYGGRVEFDLGFLVEQLVVGGTYDRLFPDCGECSYWKTGGQVGLQGGIGYIGLGLFFSRLENPGPEGTAPTDDWTYDLVGAVRYPLKGFIAPFFEIRNEFGQGILNRQTLALGVLLGPYLGGDPRRANRRTR